MEQLTSLDRSISVSKTAPKQSYTVRRPSYRREKRLESFGRALAFVPEDAVSGVVDVYDPPDREAASYLPLASRFGPAHWSAVGAGDERGGPHRERLAGGRRPNSQPVHPTGMSDRLAGDVAVVTGGGAGIGEAACLRFAEEGAHVVAVDWDGEAARATAETIEEAGGPAALGVETDVSDEAAVEAMADTVAEEFGRVDVLVNNAGIRVDPKPVTEADEASWDRILGVNLKGYAFCAKHLLPLMGDGDAESASGDGGTGSEDTGRDGGSVVNIASIGATWARPGWSQYDATKGAILSMTQDMACDHAEQGIRVNALSPGWVITDYHVGDRTGEDAERFIEENTTRGGHEGNILERAARPEELADAMLFLASEESSFMTGVNVPVDGGASVV